MKCVECVIILDNYDIDKYRIKQEDDEIFAHTHNIRIDDVRLAMKHKKM